MLKLGETTGNLRYVGTSPAKALSPGQNTMETLSMAARSSSLAPMNFQLPPASILKQLNDLWEKIFQFCQVGEILGMDADTILNMDASIALLICFVKEVLVETQAVEDASSLDSNPRQPKKISKSRLRCKKNFKSRKKEAETTKTTETLSMPACLNYISLNNLPLPTTSILLKQAQELHNEMNLTRQVVVSLGMDGERLLNLESSVAAGMKFVEKVLKEGQVPDSYSLISNPVHPLVEFNKLSINEAETMKMRYLYVSNGHEIYLLDIKKINASGAPTLPIIAALNLIEERYPVSVSLFKLGSDAYIIGGREYNADMTLHGWGEHGCKGTSHKSFRLSIAAANNENNINNDTVSLTLSKGIIGKMKRSKISPIVEEINGAIHVFDTTLKNSSPSFDWNFSHEVLHEVHGHPSCLQWRKISTRGRLVEEFIRDHLVVGPCIYALCGQKALWFDSEENYWRVDSFNHERLCDPDLFKTVWDILTLGGEARCVLELGGGENRMYAIITVSEDPTNRHFNVPLAAAYLLNSSGKIVCTQPLDHFFEGYPIQPIGMKAARLIRADDEGKTMCSLVTTSGLTDPPRKTADHCVFINTFTVKEHTSFDSARFGTAENPARAEFICVDIKGRYIYKTENRLHMSLQACFV